MASSPKAPVSGLTTRHIVYLVLMHMVGAMILDAGINFGIATAMYKNNSHPVTLWPLPQTLAGDAGVTIIIQQLLTWILDRRAVFGDLKKGMVAPLRMPPNAGRILQWFVGLEEAAAGAHCKTFKEKLGFLVSFHGRRIAVIVLATFVLYWPITIGILSGLRIHGVGADHSFRGGDFNVWPFPEIYKGVYGAAVGLTTPFMSYITLIYQGETQHLNTVSGNDDLALNPMADTSAEATSVSAA